MISNTYRYPAYSTTGSILHTKSIIPDLKFNRRFSPEQQPPPPQPPLHPPSSQSFSAIVEYIVSESSESETATSGSAQSNGLLQHL